MKYINTCYFIKADRCIIKLIFLFALITSSLGTHLYAGITEISGCHNGGTTYYDHDIEYCACPPESVGEKCETTLSQLESSPDNRARHPNINHCHNGGMPLYEHGTLHCNCLHGTFGQYCEISPNSQRATEHDLIKTLHRESPHAFDTHCIELDKNGQYESIWTVTKTDKEVTYTQYSYRFMGDRIQWSQQRSFTMPPSFKQSCITGYTNNIELRLFRINDEGNYEEWIVDKNSETLTPKKVIP